MWVGATIIILGIKRARFFTPLNRFAVINRCCSVHVNP